MKKTQVALFKNLILGLKRAGWENVGGNEDTFRIMQKGKVRIKIFADNYDKPNHFIVRFC